MGSIIGGKFYACPLCGKVYMAATCAKAMHWHLREEHDCDADEAYALVGEAMMEPIAEETYDIKGCSF